MLNNISGQGTPPINTVNPSSDDLAKPYGSPGGNSQSPEAGNASDIEKEIEQTLLALTQELSQIASLLQGQQGLPQSSDNDSGSAAPGISSGSSGPASMPEPGSERPMSLLQVEQPPPAASGADPAASSTGGTAGAAPSGALGPNVPTALQPFVQDINAASKQTGVPASLLGAQILQESGGNPNAVTTNPALGLPDTGLMQIDQKTFQGLQQQNPSLLGGKSVSDPATNIMAGALYDAQLLKKHNGNLSAALTEYNGAADSGYVNEVTAKMNALQNGTPVPGGFS